MDTVSMILAAAVRSGTPILYATLGEILTEKVGILNLGLEGIMLMGAFSGFVVSLTSGNPWIGFAAAFIVGCLMGLIHAFLCISLNGNQVVCGLALTMFGTGLSSLLGRNYFGVAIQGLQNWNIPILSDIPIIGQVIFSQDALVYLSYILVAVMFFFLNSTRPGLNLRAVGDNPHAADAMGLPVVRIKYLYTVVGAGIVAVGGAYMSIVYNKFWAETMTAGRGWIAVAMVIFAIWNPIQAALGAYLFGGIEALQLRLQATGTSVPMAILLAMPYVITLFVLVVISIRKGNGIKAGAPASLGVPFYREERD
ncbi:MAG: ABC transporter permease [Synergistaceae bacterium]|nr:ABC transporter permease [Synergistaceae bacterium]